MLYGSRLVNRGASAELYTRKRKGAATLPSTRFVNNGDGLVIPPLR